MSTTFDAPEQPKRMVKKTVWVAVANKIWDGFYLTTFAYPSKQEAEMKRAPGESVYPLEIEVEE